MSRVSAAESSLVPAQPAANTSRSRAIGPSRPGKRLVLCEDGSWLNSSSGSIRGSVHIPSNVTRISRAVKPLSSDGIPQIVNYHWGVGAGGGVTNKIAGISGHGLAEIVREGYQFIATNWLPGDEIFIFGFSRGAFSARSIAGLIGEVGILTNEGLPYLAEIFRDVQRKHDRDYVPKHPDLPFPNKPSALDPDYKYELQRRRMTRLDVPVKVVGVWETVGSLGTPKLGWLTRLGLQSKSMKEVTFYDTSLGNHIEYAFQALALDERRYAFPPTLWEKFEGNRTTLRQVWFPGAHSNVGGGYDDQQIATISLAWMMAQCQPFLDFDLDYAHDQMEDVEIYYEKTDQKIRPWSFGKIFGGMEGVYALGGSKVRTPGRYTAIDPHNGRITDDPLMDTHEYIHPSVRSRIKLHGPGLDDRGDYDCKALQDWKLVVEWPEEAGAKRPSIFWKSRTRPPEGFEKILPEAPLWQLEMDLLHYDTETEKFVLSPAGVRQGRRKSQRRSSPVASRPRSRGVSRSRSARDRDEFVRSKYR
ncbi:hypothetical protein AC578_3711 [Pseudocercospora eumusae]|uniref:T6SS Phospholipase effector Tle1-like catalytic domain-containing protein n=1 Tax=Pseudocercospora eumusae TaxID=321146 RepID=A0A139HSY0_9PEZI|nr:hypothetical protein AC578_3711 [Pseudocercospora eumusae]